MTARLVGYFRLMRLANIVTAVSDILAGVAIAGSVISVARGFTLQPLPLSKLIIQQDGLVSVYPILLLALATIGLYGGGVVLNDVFDAELDKKERPERPIPSGLISKRSAAIFGICLLIMGVAAAAYSSPEKIFSASAILALVISIAAVVYDKWMKHHRVLGPLNMGICRGCNLLLGMSLFSFTLQLYWYIAIAPVIYIAAITMISRGEVHGGKKTTLYLAAGFYSIVIAAIVAVAYLNHNMMDALPLVILFGILIFPSLQKAIQKPEGPRIGKAVKSGVIGLIAMNASWAAAFGDIYFAIIILILLPISVLLARLFAVT